MRFNEEVKGFVRAEGTKLVNGAGREILLRGVGLGSWLLPEGYMWRFPQQGDRPRRIERMVESLIGPEKAERFWATYYDRYIGEADIRRMAEEGFNSVRVPINWRFLVEEADDDGPVRYRERHFRLLDRLIDWCRTHRLYVILDLHGAPGGQTGTNIDDSERDHPELFTDERNEALTIELWRTLAKRYKDEWIVAGYDLLNEPLPEFFSQYNDRVMPLYKKLVQAIREVDDRHMIILEGVHWATDWSIFEEKIDDNLLLQFHKYWNNPDTESIRPYLDKRDEWNVPIFMGEGGENNKEWYAGAFRLFEDHRISWNFWTWKKMDTTNSPCSINKPKDWQLLTDYLEGKGKPDAGTAERILQEYLDNLPLERCTYHPEVVHALFRRLPVRIPAIFYGYQGEGIGYGIGRRAERNVGFRITDGTDIRFIEGNRQKATFQHGGGESWAPDERLSVRLDGGDWLAYDFTVRLQEGEASVQPAVAVRGCAPDGAGRVRVTVNGKTTGTASFDAAWSEVSVSGQMPLLGEGEHRIVLEAEGGPVQLEWLDLNVAGRD